MMMKLRELGRGVAPGMGAVAVILAASVGASIVTDGPDRMPDPRASAPASPAGLDDIPGLGRSENAVERDDMIALWVSWRRAASVQECMRQAGHSWRLQLDYPVAAVPEVAEAIGVSAGGTASSPDPVAANDSYVASLDKAGQDDYFRSLVGESAADVERAKVTGGVPKGRDDFRQGGCVGAAREDVGSIWDLKRELAPELAELRSEAQRTAEFAAEADDYAQCARSYGADVRSPGELEEAGLAVGVIGAVTTNCDEHWSAAHAAGLAALAPGFIAAHQDRIDRQMERYRGSVEDLRRDDAFRRAIEQELRR